MAKKTGAFKSLVRGVSEQVPQDRLEGQNWEQVNMISDPIRGLSRRRGSQFRGNMRLLDSWELTDDTVEDLATFKEFSFYYQSEEYCAIYRTRNYADSDADLQNKGVYCYNKDTGEFLETVITSTAQPITEAGVSSVANVGQYILMASAHFQPSHNEVNKVEEHGNWSFIWVRSGDYSRTYTASIQTDRRVFAVSYTTMKSYYDQPLDTSDIPVLDESGEVREEYQKEVNDRVNQYNGAVNQHLAAATADIQPQNIAQKLLEAVQAQGLASDEIEVGRKGASVALNGAISVLVEDGGSGDDMIATSKEVESLDKLTKINRFGKTVRVQITDAEPYYVVARPKRENDTDGWGEVIWREGPGIEYTPNFMFLTCAIRGNTFYVGAGPNDLEQLMNDGTDVPKYLSSSAGDSETSPLPEIFNRPLNYLGLFQDRLVMVSGATVFMSRSGDYFNFFRKSVLQVDADDPIEIYALGSEDDFIRAGAMIDRNFVLFGDRQQYYINGREPMTPQNAFIAVLSSHEGATSATPASLGGLMFFSQYRGGRTNLMQMQTGSFSDTLDAFSVSQQLSTYLDGEPSQILAFSNPDNVILRTANNRYGFYIYTFMDAPGQEQRYFDSWSRWTWDTRLGQMCALTSHDNNTVVFTIRRDQDGYLLVADEFSRESAQDNKPHLDSWIPGEAAHDGAPEDVAEAYWSVLPGGHERQYYGVTKEDRGELIALEDVGAEDVYTGVPFRSYYEPTAPYRRDQNGVAILDGRMTLSSMLFSVAGSGAFTVDMWMSGSDDDLRRVLDSTNWRLNDSRVVLGAVPVRDGQHRAFIGREIREHRLRVSAKRWLPLTFTTVEWEAQIFSNRGRR